MSVTLRFALVVLVSGILVACLPESRPRPFFVTEFKDHFVAEESGIEPRRFVHLEEPLVSTMRQDHSDFSLVLTVDPNELDPRSRLTVVNREGRPVEFLFKAADCPNFAYIGRSVDDSFSTPVTETLNVNAPVKFMSLSWRWKRQFYNKDKGKRAEMVLTMRREEGCSEDIYTQEIEVTPFDENGLVRKTINSTIQIKINGWVNEPGQW